MPFIFTRKGIKEPDIRMYFRYSGKTLKFDTGEKVKKASDWHKEKQRVKGAVTGAGEINDVLDSIESKVK